MKWRMAWAVMALTMGGDALAAAPARPPIVSVSHLSVYAADPVKSEAFYAHDLGGLKAPDPEDPRGVRYYFSPVQFVEVLPLPSGPSSINRFNHAAFNTPDAEAMHAYLAAKGFAPTRVEKGADGSRWFDVADPEGMTIQFVQPPASPPSIPLNPIFSHIIHFGFIVHNRAREDAFYRNVLGFRPYWAGGMKDDTPTWISLQVPDGRDWMEYMVVGTPDTKGVPATMSQANLGVLNHFSLGVANAEATYTKLWNADRLHGQEAVPKIGRDAKWQLNLLDPDGTRAEIMEFHAIGKPCCTPFTGVDPDK
jgi:catechol 2,3-dioxygenase-like lactoylglutathione lyase family enzyme